MSPTAPCTDIAARLRAARLEKGLAIEALARELRNPVAVLESIERGEWARLGAPVFARHLVGRYAERLGVDVDVEAVARLVEAPVLRSQVPASKLGRFADFSARHVAYVAGTLLVVPAVYTLLSLSAGRPGEVRPLDPVAVAVPSAAPATAEAPDRLPADAGVGAALEPTRMGLETATASDAARSEASRVEASGPESVASLASTPGPTATPTALPGSPTPVAASLAGPVAASGRELELRFAGASWIEVLGTDGRTLRQVLASEGDVLRFRAADVGRVTVGNVEATEVRLDGSLVNLDSVRAANVARFALSSNGSIEAVAR